MGKPIAISPSSLGLFKDCQRCFYLDRIKKQGRPRGAYPTLPSGMDKIVKDYYDIFREKGMPPLLEGKLGNLKLFKNQDKLARWRQWNATDLRYNYKGVTMAGAIDDCLTDPEGILTPLDNKTKGSGFKEAPEKYAEKYYQTQLDSYALLFTCGGFKVSDKAFLIYYIPSLIQHVPLKDGGYSCDTMFDVTVIKIGTNIERVKELVAKAEAVLTSDKIPEPSENCEYCKFVESRK